MEIWKDIIDFEGLYQISNLGRVKSLERKVSCGHGALRTVSDRILKFGKLRTGYFYVNLCKDHKYYTKTVHRLVVIAFISNPYNKPQVNHKSGIKTENGVSNLEWATSKENCVHAVKTGLHIILGGKDHPSFGRTGILSHMFGKMGKDHHLSVPVSQFTKQGQLVRSFAGLREAERETGFDNRNIGKCCIGKVKSVGGYLWKYQDRKEVALCV